MTIKNNQIEVPFTEDLRLKLESIESNAEKNPPVASQVQAESGVDNLAYMTALRVKQAIAVFASSAGEANTASNVGAGSGIFKEKVSLDLRFKTLVAGTNVTITPGTDTITISASGGGGGAVDSVNGKTGVVVLNADDISDAATTNKWFSTSERNKLTGIEAGAQVNPSIVSQSEAEAGTSTTARLWTAQRVKQAIYALGGSAGEANTASNLGSSEDGEGLFTTKDGVNLPFKRIKAGSNITLTPSTNSIEISASGGGGIVEELVIQLGAGSSISEKVSAAPSGGIPDGITIVDGSHSSVDSQLTGNTDDMVIIHGKGKVAIAVQAIGEGPVFAPTFDQKMPSSSGAGFPPGTMITSSNGNQTKISGWNIAVGANNKRTWTLIRLLPILT